MKLIEPGPIVTDFYGRSRQFIKPTDTDQYDEFIQKFNELDMFNKLNRLINEDVVINLDLFPLYDTFKRFNNSSQAGQYFY